MGDDARLSARTRIDDFATPLEEAEILGLNDMAEAMRKIAGDRAAD